MSIRPVPVRLMLVLLAALVCQAPVRADEPESRALAGRVIAAAGGQEKLLKLFRMTESLNVSSDPEKKPNARTSVLEPPLHWWVGKKDRVREDKEPATWLVWAWTLGPLTDPTSVLELIPDVMESEKPAVGLRVSGSVTPPMELYFDKADHRLVRIDWRSDIHRFSDWKDHDGVRYPARCVGYKKATGKAWYFTEITQLERLSELPEGLTR